MGGRKGKGQQEQNAPRAKKLARAPPEGSARWFCMREKEAESSKTAGGQRRGAGRKQREEIERGGTERRNPR